eukprot:2592069-Rhodomonas_salina.2
MAIELSEDDVCCFFCADDLNGDGVSGSEGARGSARRVPRVLHRPSGLQGARLCVSVRASRGCCRVFYAAKRSCCQCLFVYVAMLRSSLLVFRMALCGMDTCVVASTLPLMHGHWLCGMAIDLVAETEPLSH